MHANKKRSTFMHMHAMRPYMECWPCWPALASNPMVSRPMCLSDTLIGTAVSTCKPVNANDVAEVNSQLCTPVSTE